MSDAARQQLLTVNGGSSSIKFALFEAGEPPRRILSGLVERIGLADAQLHVQESAGEGSCDRSIEAPDHAHAVEDLGLGECGDLCEEAVELAIVVSFPVGADQQQRGRRVRQDLLEQRAAGRVAPLQVVEQDHERMLRRGACVDEALQREGEARLCLARLEARSGRQLAQDEREVRNQIHQGWCGGAQSRVQLAAPAREPCVALHQQLLHQRGERRDPAGVRLTAVEVELRGRQIGVGLREERAQLIDQRRLAGSGSALDPERPGPTPSGVAVDRVEQRGLALAPVELRREARLARGFGGGQREVVGDAARLLDLPTAGVKICEQRGRARVALLRLLAKQLQEHLGERSGQLGPQLERRLRSPREVRMDQLERILRLEGRASGECVVQGGAERIEITARVTAAVHAPGLLRRDVLQGSADAAIQRLTTALRGAELDGQAEVADPDARRAAVEQHVAGREVLVEHARLVDARERFARLARELEPARHVERPLAQGARERSGRHAFQDEQRPIGRPVQGERLRNPRPGDPAHRLELAARPRVGIRRPIPQIALEHDLGAVRLAHRLVHLGACARVQLLAEPEAVRRAHHRPASAGGAADFTPDRSDAGALP